MKKHYFNKNNFYKYFNNGKVENMDIFNNNFEIKILFRFNYYNEFDIFTHFLYIQLDDTPEVNDMLIYNDTSSDEKKYFIITNFDKSSNTFDTKLLKNEFKL